jgi:hypothetical protein
MTFDVAQFENKDEGTFTFRLQNGEEMMVDGKPVVCRMHGLGSKAQVRAEYKLTRENTATTMAALTNRPASNAEEETFKRGAQYLADCTISIDNWPVSPLDTYLNHKLGYMSEQADKFLKNAANFMRPSTASSPSTSAKAPG